jgi:hypothetical protein
MQEARTGDAFMAAAAFPEGPALVQGLDAFLANEAVVGYISDDNRTKSVRVAQKLVSGGGVTNKNRPGKAFREGRPISLNEDLLAVRAEANEWLPRSETAAVRDGGNGWAIDHAIGKLVAYKDHLLGKPIKKAVRRAAASTKRTRDSLGAEEEKRSADDGELYTKAEFEKYFGGLDEWNAAEAEKRTAEDGELYTKAEFEEYYGGLAGWHAAMSAFPF